MPEVPEGGLPETPEVPEVDTETLEIQEAFLEGIDLVFSTMFTKRCKLLLWNSKANSVSNVYKESRVMDKSYLPPIDVTAKLVLTTQDVEQTIENTKRKAVITLPTKVLIDNNIPFRTQNDLLNLEKSMFYIDGIFYVADVLNPKVFVGNIHQMYEFICHPVKNDVIGGSYGWNTEIR